MPKKQLYQAATEEFYKLANEAVRQKQDFTLETSFRDEPLLDIVAQFKRFGYTTNMIYLVLDSVKQSTDRVAERVSKGGHYVDLKNIQQNYNEGLHYLERFAKGFDNLDILDATKGFGEFEKLLKIEQKQLIYINAALPENVAQTINNIAGHFRNKGWDNSMGR